MIKLRVMETPDVRYVNSLCQELIYFIQIEYYVG